MVDTIRAAMAGDPGCCEDSNCPECADCGDCANCDPNGGCLCDGCPGMGARITTPPSTAHIRYQHVIRAAAQMPWAILPEKLNEIGAFLELKTAGLPTPPYAAQPQRTINRSGAVAVIPLFGVISQRMGMMSEFSGGTSTERITQQFRQAVADPDVAAILFDVDSPGGGVFGVDELASEIRAARGQKPIVAAVNSMCASAAYWIASACDEIAVTPSGQTGSIGVFAMHMDMSKAIAGAGMTPTLIKAGKYKAEGVEEFPLTAEARDALQAQVDQYYGQFVNAVAAGRNTNAASVKAGFGEGRVVGAKDAVRLGMADRVETFDATLARLMQPQGRAAVKRRTAADDEWLPPIANSAPIWNSQGDDSPDTWSAPPSVRDVFEPPTPTKRETEQALRDAGYSSRAAKAFIARGWVGPDRDNPPAATEPAKAETTGMVAGPATLARRRFELEKLIHAV